MVKKNIQSPFAPKKFPRLPKVPGVNLSAGSAGIRHKKKKDLLLVTFDPGTSVSGVTTKNEVCGAPVEWSRKSLSLGKSRALVVNSGNANVNTGHKGKLAAKRTAKQVASFLNCNEYEVVLASTGVIGEEFPIKSVMQCLPKLYTSGGGDSWENAATSIMTTDTYPKGASRSVKILGHSVTISGIAKGSGMIAPNMATMLAFIFTDANLSPRVLNGILKPAVAKTFNCITVDGDTSTSDMCMLFATRKSTHPAIANITGKELGDFCIAINDICNDLAMQIIRDGEGVTKVAEIFVTGARSNKSAKFVANSIGNSPLFKTALAASDPNWGRIASAAGNAGQKIDSSRLTIGIGNQVVSIKGELNSAYSEAKAARHMKGTFVNISLDLGQGNGSAKLWSTDLTHRYIDINAGYRS